MDQLNTLNFKDLYILRRFIEKCQRENLFTREEKYSADILHSRLISLINGAVNKDPNTISLTFQDLCIMRNFIKTGQESKVLYGDEVETVDILHTKLCNIIDEVVARSKAEEVKGPTSGSGDPSK